MAAEIESEIARRIAKRLAPSVDRSLPAHVERLIAEGGAEDGVLEQFDPAHLMQFAGFVVALGMAAWTIAKDLRERREKAALATAQAARIEVLEQDVAFLKGALLGRLRIEVEPPATMSARVRDDAYEVAAEEALAGVE